MGVLLAALVLSPVLAHGFQSVQLHKRAQRPSKALTAEGDVPLLNYLDAQVASSASCPPIPQPNQQLPVLKPPTSCVCSTMA
jgi:hypothetical protein